MKITKLNSFEGLKNIKLELSPNKKNSLKNNFEITDYSIAFIRKSSNTYENIRLLCIFTYEGQKLFVPIYARFERFDKELQEKQFCSQFNAPRAPFFKSISEKEFYTLMPKIGMDNFKKEDLIGLIKFEIERKNNE